jgi:excinuclease UvrABC nuclease subunit
LVKYFGSVSAIRDAQVDEIAMVPGINAAVANKIWEHFHAVPVE